MSETIIQVTNLNKDFKLPHKKIGTIKNIFTNIFSIGNQTYELQHALKNISFEVKKGEFFGIVGRNGSGKSTLLKILAGIYQPTNGHVQVNGRLVPFIELGVGFNGELTGRENVFLNGALMGFSEKEIDAKYQKIVDFSGIERFMDQKLKNFSSGMQVRLAFSLAIQANADILLIDEVLAVGDADFQRKCFEYFHQLKKSKKTVVFVSHDMNSIREYCDKAILIEGNTLILSDTANKVADAYIKMFLKETQEDLKETVEETNRWGNNKLHFKSVQLSKKILQDTDESFEISTLVTANETISNPIFGFSITDPNGARIMGTNSQIKKFTIKTIKVGESFEVIWKIPNTFSEGKHFVNLAVVYDNGTTIADWWDEADNFKVIKEEKTPYILSPKFELKIIQKIK